MLFSHSRYFSRQTFPQPREIFLIRYMIFIKKSYAFFD